MEKFEDFKKGDYWKGKVERKQKEKRRPEDMTKKEWEDDKEKRRDSKVKNQIEELRKKGEKK